MRTGEVTTNDGVRLHYVDAGTGPDLLLVSGWWRMTTAVTASPDTRPMATGWPA
jgi:hypothetical protein